jgi:hypothetical protein
LSRGSSEEETPLLTRLGAIPAFVAILAASVYVFGLVTLWAPIARTYTQTTVARHGLKPVLYAVVVAFISFSLLVLNNFINWIRRNESLSRFSIAAIRGAIYGVYGLYFVALGVGIPLLATLLIEVSGTQLDTVFGVLEYHLDKPEWVPDWSINIVVVASYFIGGLVASGAHRYRLRGIVSDDRVPPHLLPGRDALVHGLMEPLRQQVDLDNPSSHKGSRVRELVDERVCELLYLPPYSPDLNPIAEAFAELKALLRRGGAGTCEALAEAFGVSAVHRRCDAAQAHCKTL